MAVAKVSTQICARFELALRSTSPHRWVLRALSRSLGVAAGTGRDATAAATHAADAAPPVSHNRDGTDHALRTERASQRPHGNGNWTAPLSYGEFQKSLFPKGDADDLGSAGHRLLTESGDCVGSAGLGSVICLVATTFSLGP